jgi:voltage-gated potassium channel
MDYLALRKRTAEILEGHGVRDRLGHSIDLFLHTLILLNVVAITLESVESLHAAYHPWFWQFEVSSVLVFTGEYLLRVWCSVDRPHAPDRRPVIGRLKYMLTAPAIIDLLAILPFYLGLILEFDLRFLRVVRLVRVLKLSRYSPALNVLLNVLRNERRVLGSAFFILFIMLVVAASGIHLIEHKVQPQAFGSIPDSMWWAVVTLTTIGYGDVVPVTPLGKLFGGMITIVGVGMVALPTAIIASGFAEQLRRQREEYEKAVFRALDDGRITEDERWALELLSKELSISREDATLLLDKIARLRIHAGPARCPHCGERLQAGEEVRAAHGVGLV